MTTPSTVNIKEAKGRPMLQWVGKTPLRHVSAYPAQLVETFTAGDMSLVEGQDKPAATWSDWPAAYPQSGLLFHGDNKEVLAHLLANGFRGKVNLIYIDPPFDSGADYVRRVSLRGAKADSQLQGTEYTLGEQIQYTDIWANDNYLQFMYERLLLLKEILADTGSIYLHSDSHRTHLLRSLLDEIFGADNFRNDIVWQRFNYRADGRKFGTVHDTILFYTKSNNYAFEKPYVSLKPSYIKTHFKPDINGRLYRLDNLTAPGHGKTGKSLRFGDTLITPPTGTMWRYAQDGIDELWRNGLIVIAEEGVPQVKRYLDEIEGQAVHSMWTDVSAINSQARERTEYPTQKPEILLERILSASSNPGDLILDAFIGSGTTAAVAQRLGRRWIGCDVNKGAIQTTSKRLQVIMSEQAAALGQPRQGSLTETDDAPPSPAQLSLAVYRVNDYDLQIQHNEALNLAAEHLGVTRTRADSFFDGTLGDRLVKIVPFNHPASPLDLDLVKQELDARPDETRDIVVVALGKELAVDGWLDAWNNLRKTGNLPNKIDVIDLRTDAKSGGFFTHQPATAKVDVSRVDGQLVVHVNDFVSPTIIERLKAQAKLLTPHIEDWRWTVDSIMIDTAYDGQVFNIALADIPPKKTDLVAGHYELDAPPDKTTVAVKITDMLGEEVLVVQQA